jgi:hypothetical protein
MNEQVCKIELSGITLATGAMVKFHPFSYSSVLIRLKGMPPLHPGAYVVPSPVSSHAQLTLSSVLVLGDRQSEQKSRIGEPYTISLFQAIPVYGGPSS